jgi:hypothetical protein
LLTDRYESHRADGDEAARDYRRNQQLDTFPLD